MNETVNPKSKVEIPNPKCKFFLLRLVHRKYYLKQIILEYLLSVNAF